MSDDKGQDLKKNVPSGFVWFVMAAFLLALFVQNFIETKFAQVSFSYQLEHLVNLQLLHPEDSRKIALNDNLVSFSGKFRDRVTEEGKQRFKFLELLNANHELRAEKERLKTALTDQQNKVIESANSFFSLSGLPIPSEGYSIIDGLSHGPEKDYSITLHEVSNKNKVNLASLSNQLNEIQANPTAQTVDAFGSSLHQLIRDFRAPLLGIGNQEMKDQLKSLDDDVQSGLNNSKLTVEAKLGLYATATQQLQQIVKELSRETDQIHLLQLAFCSQLQRPFDENTTLLTKLEDNTLKLDKARQSCYQCDLVLQRPRTFYTCLEKQDPEEFNHWFATAKKSGII